MSLSKDFQLNYYSDNMSRSTRKPTLWTLRKVFTLISLSMPCMLTWTDTLPLVDFVSRIIPLYPYPSENVQADLGRCITQSP